MIALLFWGKQSGKYHRQSATLFAPTDLLPELTGMGVAEFVLLRPPSPTLVASLPPPVPPPPWRGVEYDEAWCLDMEDADV